MKKVIYLVLVSALGVSLMVCSPRIVWAEESAGTNDFNFAYERYNEVFGKIQYDSASMKKQLVFNEKREKELQAELKEKERFLSSLPRRMGKHLSRMKTTTAGKNEQLLKQAAEEFRGDYDALCKETAEEVDTLKKDLAKVQGRIAVLESQIGLKQIRKDLHPAGIKALKAADDEPCKSAVAYLEDVAAGTMQDEVKNLEKPEIVSTTQEDAYRANLLKRENYSDEAF